MGQWGPLNACCIKQQRTSQGSPLNANCQRPEKGPSSTPTSFPEYLVPPSSLLFKQPCYPHARFSLGQSCQRLEKEKENPKSTKKKKTNSTKSCICGRQVPCTPGTTKFPTIQAATSPSRQVPTGARLQETRKNPTSAISPAPVAAVSPAYLGLPRSL